MRPIPHSAIVLSAVSAASAAVASVATLASSQVFPAPSSSAANQVLWEARGWSLTTLSLALPLCLFSVVSARRGSLRGRMVWLGTLAYLLYTYLEFAVSPPFSALFLVYVLAFACAIPALVIGVLSLDMESLPQAFVGRIPRRSIAAFALASAVLLALAWLKDIATRSLAGEFGWPQGVEAVGHVVHALDLGLQVPLGIATWLLLTRRRPGGYVAAAIMLVNSVCMGTALTAMVAWAGIASGGGALGALPFAILPIIAGALAIKFFRALPPGAVSAGGQGPSVSATPNPA